MFVYIAYMCYEKKAFYFAFLQHYANAPTNQTFAFLTKILPTTVLRAANDERRIRPRSPWRYVIVSICAPKGRVGW